MLNPFKNPDFQFDISRGKQIPDLEATLFTMVEKRPLLLTKVAMGLKKEGFKYEGKLSIGVERCNSWRREAGFVARLTIIMDRRSDKTIKFLARSDRKDNKLYLSGCPDFEVGHGEIDDDDEGVSKQYGRKCLKGIIQWIKSFFFGLISGKKKCKHDVKILETGRDAVGRVAEPELTSGKSEREMGDRIQKTGTGCVTWWRFKTESIGFGYISDNESKESFFFETRGIIDDALNDSLSLGKIGQIVWYSIIKERVGNKYAVVQVLQLLKDLGDSDSRYKSGHKAMISGDLKNAEILLHQVVDDRSAESRLSALKDLAETYNRQGKTKDAFDVIEQYRKEFPAEEWGSFERMQIGYLEREGNLDGALRKVKTLLKQCSTMSEGQRAHYERKRDVLRTRISSPTNIVECTVSDESKSAETEMEIVKDLRQQGLSEAILKRLPLAFENSNQPSKIILSQLDNFRRCVGWSVRRRIYRTIQENINDASFPQKVTTAIVDVLEGELERQAAQLPQLQCQGPASIKEDENTIELCIRLLRQSDVPLRDLQIYLVDEMHHTVGQPIASCEKLAYEDGEKRLSMPVRLSTREVQNKRGSIQYEIRFKKDLDDDLLSKMGENTKGGVALGRIDFHIGDNVFTPITPNPFELYCNHDADGDFFVGREVLLNDMVDCLSNRNGGQAYILYGQAKTGKSSVRKNLKCHLAKKLGESVLYTEINIKDWGRGDAGKKMKREPLRWVSFELEMSAVEDVLRPLGKWTDDDEAVLSKFPKDYYAGRLKFLGRCLRKHGFIWIVSIDEFSELYDVLQSCPEDQQLRDNMASLVDVLKGRLEGGSFNLLLVGLGSMENFISEFRNEFHVLKKVRLSYLDSQSTVNLLTVPLDGKLQIEKDAAERFFSLTGGFPLYVMYFCRDIVRYANKSGYSTITLEDIEAISDSICEGPDKWSPDEFDPFFQIGIKSYNGHPLDESILAELYYEVAGNGNDVLDCPSDAFDQRPGHKDLLKILCEYGVLVKGVNETVSFSVGIFAKYLQRNQGFSCSDFKKLVV